MSSSLTGLILIVACLFLYMISLWRKNKILLTLRTPSKEKIDALRHRIANSMEEGAGVHIDISNSSENAVISGSAQVALQTVRTLSAQLAPADQPLQVTNNQSALTFFSREAVQNGVRQSGLENEFNPDSSVFVGYSPLTHQSGLIAQLKGEQSALHLNIGAFGAEIALQDLAFDNTEGLIAAGENPIAQAVAYGTADESFIGEELFELPEALKPHPGTDSSLVVMDLFRIGVILAILGGSIFTVFAALN